MSVWVLLFLLPVVFLVAGLMNVDWGQRGGL